MLFKAQAKGGFRPAAYALGALLAAAPFAPALAQSNAPADQAMSDHATKAEAQADTVDQRIASLHEELKITPAEESDWQQVATTMKDNADAMAKLAADKANQPGMTAVQDLQTYTDFAQAHVTHLQKLTTAFTKLYGAMPDDQKKLADQVFQQNRQQEHQHQG
jgi:uncharacterized protein Yka (UPF0111/DUF47 family)